MNKLLSLSRADSPWAGASKSSLLITKYHVHWVGITLYITSPFFYPQCTSPIFYRIARIFLCSTSRSVSKSELTVPPPRLPSPRGALPRRKSPARYTNQRASSRRGLPDVIHRPTRSPWRLVFWHTVKVAQHLRASHNPFRYTNPNPHLLHPPPPPPSTNVL